VQVTATGADDPRQATGQDCYLLGMVFEPGTNSVSVPPTDALVGEQHRTSQLEHLAVGAGTESRPPSRGARCQTDTGSTAE